MMCKCYDSSNAQCNCMHHKMPMLCGIGFVILGVVLYLTNYGWLDGGIWQWLLPAALVLGGLHHTMMCGMKRMDDCKMCNCMKGDKKPDMMMKDGMKDNMMGEMKK